ncbi:23S rRNA (adenine(2503)-C(2))-methyltransferase [Dehalogenimonas formicexedens]|uniref:Probable dual-specificity RNA methyltransferase RlmN n=1 Tax=Dehalogenimonas formicexedens TaxID=1839801 RepID=A0A1P8F7K8_9CHLR|nr:23S rRNA (adenine(2503)-C(2))-methyltransferase RlmN [Dehalogenimonas formicexedens]APV44438.1 23S rRNA (adenine(2503)-C(2))-methyltransferase [Dehalogenimonas formicexedens]
MKNRETSLFLLGHDTRELIELAESENMPPFRGRQLADWLYRKGARDFDEMVTLPSSFRETLRSNYTVGRSKEISRQKSPDGTIKLLLELRDGARVETVGMPYAERFSCCVSTQAGCPVGCAFCATGQSGFKRNLAPGEIIDQVLTVNGALNHQEAPGVKPKIDHVTFMGMGEPLLNYDSIIKALRLMTGELGISARHLTVSTVGYVPGIRSLMKEKLPVTLAVSLHAPNDELRQRLIPGLKKWNVAKIIDACREYFAETGRRITIEYCLMDRVNDSQAEATQLSELLHGLNCHVNLIPFNPADGLPFKPSNPARVKAFSVVLASHGIQVTQRLRRGADIDAACGQLRRREEKRLLPETGEKH